MTKMANGQITTLTRANNTFDLKAFDLKEGDFIIVVRRWNKDRWYKECKIA